MLLKTAPGELVVVCACTNDANGSFSLLIPSTGTAERLACRRLDGGSCDWPTRTDPQRPRATHGRFLEADEPGAKAAIFNINRVTGRPVELEEAWIIYALMIEDGLQQIEAAHLLGRHKSWVNRRLALIERLCHEARESLRLGLITPTQARHLTRLPRGNQNAAMQSATHAAFTSREISDMVDLLFASSTRSWPNVCGSFALDRPSR